MISEPYICIKGERAGEIEWFATHELINGASHPLATWWENTNTGESWQSYADFEREKLKELGGGQIIKQDGMYGYSIAKPFRGFPKIPEEHYWHSFEIIGYREMSSDSESSRLLKRAEFLKAVCEVEEVPWLPSGDSCDRGESLGESQPVKVPVMPERDYYTKEEIDELFGQLILFIRIGGVNDATWNSLEKFSEEFLS